MSRDIGNIRWVLSLPDVESSFNHRVRIRRCRTQADTARLYEVSRSWVSKLVVRYRAEGEAAFEPRSRRPHTSPRASDPVTVALIIELRSTLADKGLDNGPHTIRWHLEQHHDLVVSVATIWRHLKAAGLITPEPKKKPKTSYIRFQADLPNEMWQSDFTYWHLTNGIRVEIITFLNDHARYALSVTAHTHHDEHRRRRIPLNRCNRRFPGINTHRQRPRLHRKIRRRERRKEPVRTRPDGPENHPETLPTKPPHHMRESRTVPTNTQKVAHRQTRSRNPQRPPEPARYVRR